MRNYPSHLRLITIKHEVSCKICKSPGGVRNAENSATEINKNVCREQSLYNPIWKKVQLSSESLGVARQPRHGHGAHAGHMRRRDLAHAARTGHPGADSPVLEAAAQGPRACGGRFQESVMGSDRRDGGNPGSGEGGGGDGRRGEERVVHRRVRSVGSRRVSRHGPRVSHSPTSRRVEAAVVPAAAVDLTDQPLHLFQRVAQHQDVVSRQEQGGDFGELAHRRSVRVGHNLPQPVHGHVQVVHSFPFTAVDLQADGLELVLRQQLAVLLGRHAQRQRLLVGGGEAAQTGDLRRGVALSGGHGAREAVHGLLQGGHEDVVHLRGGRSAGHSACV